jgi:hypothetical protein
MLGSAAIGTLMKFGLLLFPGLTQLGLTGPLEVFSRMRGVEPR